MCDCKEFDREFTCEQGIVFATYTCVECGGQYIQTVGETWKPEGKELQEWRRDY